MTSKMKDYKYCNQLFDMALDNGVVTEQDREQFMDSELFNLIKNETYLTAICAWISGKYAETVLNALYEKGFRCVDPSYKRKTTTKPTTDRIKEVFEEWLSCHDGLSMALNAILINWRRPNAKTNHHRNGRKRDGVPQGL